MSALDGDDHADLVSEPKASGTETSAIDDGWGTKPVDAVDLDSETPRAFDTENQEVNPLEPSDLISDARQKVEAAYEPQSNADGWGSVEDFAENTQEIQGARQLVNVAYGNAQDTVRDLGAEYANDPGVHNLPAAQEIREGAQRGDEKSDSSSVDQLRELQMHLSISELVESSNAKDITSIEEAEAFARNELGIRRVDLGDFDLDSAREVTASLDALRTKYPQVDGLNFLGSIQSRNDLLESEQPQISAANPDVVAEPLENEVAVTLRGAGDLSGISFNKRWVSDLSTAEVRMRLDEAAGSSAEGVGSVRGVVSHEFGHAVENHLRKAGSFDRTAGPIIDSIVQSGGDWIADNVGLYASTSKEELFAELFAEYQCSTHPRKAARLLGDAIDNYYWNS